MTDKALSLAVIVAAVFLVLGVEFYAHAQSALPLPQGMYTAQGVTNMAGVFNWTYPAPCAASSYFFAIAQGPNSSAGVLMNVQLLGSPVHQL